MGFRGPRVQIPPSRLEKPSALPGFFFIGPPCFSQRRFAAYGQIPCSIATLLAVPGFTLSGRRALANAALRLMVKSRPLHCTFVTSQIRTFTIAEMPSKAKPKAKSASRTSKPPKSSTKGDWRAETLANVRRMIHEADPEIVEERKWKKPSTPLGVPVWSRDGIICTGETYKDAVKLTFARGASLKDPRGLFNSSLEGHTRRAIDIREGEVLDAGAFKALVNAAVAENRLRAKKR